MRLRTLLAFAIALSMLVGLVGPAAAAVRTKGDLAADWAVTQVGAPYVWGGEGPGYDCSGLTTVAYRRQGLSITHQSRAQYAETARLSRSNLRRGDLSFYSSNGTASGINHVAMFLGSGRFVESNSYYGGVLVRTESSMRAAYAYGRVPGARVGVCGWEFVYNTGSLVPYVSRGPAVTEWQRMLVRYGISPGPIDGIYGPLTYNATVRFQRAEGVPIPTKAGYVGPMTRDAMVRALAC